jgi:hypothetical protein
VGYTGISTEILEIWDTEKRFGEDFPWEVQPDPWEIQEDTAKSGQDIDRDEREGVEPGDIERFKEDTGRTAEIQGDPGEIQKIRGKYMNIQDARYREIY